MDVTVTHQVAAACFPCRAHSGAASWAARCAARLQLGARPHELFCLGEVTIKNKAHAAREAAAAARRKAVSQLLVARRL